MRVFGRNAERCAVRVGESFAVQLDVDGRPGFEWIPSFDPETIAFLGKEMPDPWERGYSRNTRRFQFAALRPGTYTIDWLHKRRWETSAIATFQIVLEVTDDRSAPHDA